MANLQFCAMPPTEGLKKAFGTINVLSHTNHKNTNTETQNCNES
jgi:hypothetical protein